jgi:hypothetical protein
MSAWTRAPKQEFPSCCRPLVSTELAAPLTRYLRRGVLKRDCLNQNAAPNAAHSLPLKGEELGWVLMSERPHQAHFAREPLQTKLSLPALNAKYIRLRLGEVIEEHARDLT